MSSQLGWRPVLVATALAQILLSVVLMAVSGEAVPPLITILVLLAIGLIVLRSRPRSGTAMVGIVTLFHLVTSTPFLAEGLVHPESFWDFWLGSAIVLIAVLCLVAAVSVWRQRDDGPVRARAASVAVAGLVAALGIAGGIATAGYESDTPQDGDIALMTSNAEFEPTRLSAVAGDIGVFIENDDPLRHTFSIDELDVDLELPGGKAARVEFTVGPGTYEFYCAVPGHENMNGELVIK